MSNMFFDVEIVGDKLFIDRAGQMQARVADTKPAWTKVAQYILGKTKRRFEAEGPGWAALSQDWVIWKINHDFDARILHQHKPGRLSGSFSRIGAPHQHLVIQNDSVAIGSTLPYAAIQQHGGKSAKGGTIPARPYLGVNKLDEHVIAQILAQYYTEPFDGGDDGGWSDPGVFAGDWVTGRSKRLGTVSGTLTDIPAFGGGRIIRGPTSFIGVYDD